MVGVSALLAAVLALAAFPAQPEAGARDKDRDGLRDRYELKRSHTNPRRADTDGDGLRDRYELKRSHTNPRRADSDGDGLQDGYELKRSHTNPRRADSDGDGLQDGVEVFLGLQVQPQPAACANGLDDDADALIDLADPGCKNSQDDDEWNAVSSPSPVASYTDSPAKPQVGQPVTFDATMSTCAAPCVYTWEDDGPDGPGGTQWPLGTGQTLTFTFRGPGTKHVRLTVKDSQARSATVVHDVVVSSAPPTPPPLPQCSDGVDNDADGLTDYPSDRGCLDALDNDETDPPPPPPSSCTRSADPSTFASAFSAAVAGDVICLASGDYGTFAGALKSGTVTIKPQTGASVTMSLAFNPASNITIDGLTIPNAVLRNAQTKNITVKNSDFPGQTTFRTGELQNANILFDHNKHHDWDACSGCAYARVWLPNQTSQPSGITIQNSEFSGGHSDGIQNGSRGTRIIGNTFHDLPGDPAIHVDAIQLYGSAQTLIKGNYFYNLHHGVGNLMAPDGADHEIVEDNVWQPFRDGTDLSRPFIDWWSDNGSVIRHNTMADGQCEFNARCGIIYLGSKSGQPAGTGTVIKDNIGGNISCCNGPATYTASYNLWRDYASGSNDIVGLSTYLGGPTPTTYAGYKLAAGSLGKGNASDGLDRGARIP